MKVPYIYILILTEKPRITEQCQFGHALKNEFSIFYIEFYRRGIEKEFLPKLPYGCGLGNNVFCEIMCLNLGWVVYGFVRNNDEIRTRLSNATPKKKKKGKNSKNESE